MNTCNTIIQQLEERLNIRIEPIDSDEPYQSDSEDDMKSCRTHRYYQIYKKYSKKRHRLVSEQSSASDSGNTDTTTGGSSSSNTSEGTSSSSDTSDSEQVSTTSEDDNSFDKYADQNLEPTFNESIKPKSPPTKVLKLESECYSVGSDSESEIESCNTADFQGTLNCVSSVENNNNNDEKYEDKSKCYTECERHVLEDTEDFDILPEGWVKIVHLSGIPMYLHKSSRVASFTKPYFIGSGNILVHDVPASAIPCLNYLKTLEGKQDTLKDSSIGFGLNRHMGLQKNLSPSVGVPVEIVKHNKNKPFTPHEVREYCKRLFKLDNGNIIDHANGTLSKVDYDNVVNSSSRSLLKHDENNTAVHSSSLKSDHPIEPEILEKKNLQCPTLPDNLKQIKLPFNTKELCDNEENVRSGGRKILNATEKSKLSILNDYVMHMTGKPPVYEVTDIPGTPNFSATIFINGEKYGSGSGGSKKTAKLEAAQKTLEILIPNMENKPKDEILTEHKNNLPKKDDISPLFDTMSIEDRRVPEVCTKTGQPYPYAILLKCLQRNYGLGETNIQSHSRNIRHQKIEYTMEVGEHTATAMCQSKRLAKQWTSQAILKQLHPQVESWGSLLRLYGNDFSNSKERKQQLQEITVLQNKSSSVDSPNLAVLDKLFIEMEKVMGSRKCRGKFIPPADETLPSTSANELNIFYKDASHKESFKQKDESKQDIKKILDDEETFQKMLSESIVKTEPIVEQSTCCENKVTENQDLNWQEEMCKSDIVKKSKQ